MNIIWEQVLGQESLSSQLFFDSCSLYGPKIVLVATLGAITIYRREMSCNHCYVEQRPSSRGDMSSEASLLLWDEEATDELLDGAGRVCSGASLVPVVSKIVGFLSTTLGLPTTVAKALLLQSQNQALTAEQMLDKAGSFCSGYPLLCALLNRVPGSISIPRRVEPCVFSAGLPADVQLHILSFLHPKDIVTMACASKTCQQIIDEKKGCDGTSFSFNLWRTIFQRDYGWLIESWDVGRAALKRSNAGPSYTKEFYFRFSQCYLNYLLAGQNTDGMCLVGIGGHIYDLSLFLESHPGSPETVMAQAGRDATSFFASICHSAGARRFAQKLCVAVDLGFLDRDACGVRPTEEAACGRFRRRGDTRFSDPDVVPPPITYQPQMVIQRKGTIKSIRDALQQEEAKVGRLITKITEPCLLGEINPYYDPMEFKWKAWYNNRHMETVFIDTLTDDTGM
jgi:hypothetical protein